MKVINTISSIVIFSVMAFLLLLCSYSLFSSSSIEPNIIITESVFGNMDGFYIKKSDSMIDGKYLHEIMFCIDDTYNECYIVNLLESEFKFK